MEKMVLKCTTCVCITAFCCCLLYYEHLYLAVALEILGIMGVIGALVPTICTFLEILAAIFKI